MKFGITAIPLRTASAPHEELRNERQQGNHESGENSPLPTYLLRLRHSFTAPEKHLTDLLDLAGVASILALKVALLEN